MSNAQQDPNPKQRLQIGKCEYLKCGKPAIYEIDFDCDDMTAYVCDKHHDEVLALFNLPDCEELLMTTPRKDLDNEVS